jgi:hypothetical protein
MGCLRQKLQYVSTIVKSAERLKEYQDDRFRSTRALHYCCIYNDEHVAEIKSKIGHQVVKLWHVYDKNRNMARQNRVLYRYR